jgi:hypothetical protein
MRRVLDSAAIETASSCASLQTYDRLRSEALAEYSRVFTDFQRGKKAKIAACGSSYMETVMIVPTLCVGMPQGTLRVQ